MERGGLRVYEQSSSIRVVGQKYVIEGILVVTTFNPGFQALSAFAKTYEQKLYRACASTNLSSNQIES